jgi:hypothetical protein
MIRSLFPDWLANSAAVVAGLSLFGLLIRQIGPWRKQVTDEETQFRQQLIGANEALTGRIEKVEKILNRERIRHNAERALDRHRLNNITACFDATLILLEMNPERAAEVVAKIKEMRAAQMVAEAEEKAIIRAAEINADEVEVDHDGN